MFKKLALIASAGMLTVSAQAATVSYNFGFPLATTEITQTGALGLFDSTLGTLTGASITVNGSSVMSFTGNNVAAQSQLANLTSNVDLYWSTDLSALSPYLSDLVSMSATSGPQNYAVGETKSFGPFNDSGSNTDDLAGILASLQTAGGGSFNVTCQSLSGMAVSGGGGNINTTQQTQAQCDALITYTYSENPPTNVPEPATLGLIGLALLGAAGARRRKA